MSVKQKQPLFGTLIFYPLETATKATCKYDFTKFKNRKQMHFSKQFLINTTACQLQRHNFNKLLILSPYHL